MRQLQRRLRQARAEVRTFAALGAERVWLFGSALDAGRFTMSSDVDLAVEGLPHERFPQADREGLDSAIPEARAEIAERIRPNGKLVASRP